MEEYHLSSRELEAGLGTTQTSPTDNGRLERIIIRTEENQRKNVESCSLDIETGLEGDYWVRECWKKLPDGSSDPDMQVSIMNSRVLDFIAGSLERWSLAGDNLIVDFDLSEKNLKTGDQMQIGSVVLEITAQPHTGCNKFKERFGQAARELVNTEKGMELHLRGRYARVRKSGEIKTGDTISKL